jgi:hypothetical protein
MQHRIIKTNAVRLQISEVADLPSGRVVMSEGAGALTGWRDGFAQQQRTSLSEMKIKEVGYKKGGKGRKGENKCRGES